MATQLDSNVKDDLKTQFITREGTYRLLTLSEYSRPNRVGYTNNQSSPQVRVSIISLPSPALPPLTTSGNGSSGNGNGSNSNSTAATANGPITQQQQQQQQQHTNNSSTNSNAGSNSLNGSGGDGITTNGTNQAVDTRLGAGGISMHSMMNGGGGEHGLDTSQIYGGERICFNFGRELYVYAFRGVKKGNEMSKPIDKKFYKNTNPCCHDFNGAVATPTGAPLLVGFTTGQIQLVSPQPGPRELRKLFNEERLIDKTKVTCLKWLPNSPNLFLASHSSGHLYLYNEDLPCAATQPTYQPFKVGDGYTIFTCKSKSTRNPLYKWTFNTENCCINEFCFSPCGSNLAIVSQDGFLRVFHYDTMDLIGIARSYFGGFLCVCWSPDGKYIVVGGEDDLVTVWSLHERRVVARGQGHRSWVSVVAFDPYTTSYTNWDGGDFSDDENQLNEYMTGNSSSSGARGGDSRFSGDMTANVFEYAGNEKKCSTPNQSSSTTRQQSSRPQSSSFRSENSSSAALPQPDKLAISYRLGSVSQDTQICLWDITEDVLRHPVAALRQRVNSSNLNDTAATSYMNGGLDSDGVKVIRPIAIGSTCGGTFATLPQMTSSPTKDSIIATAAAAENNSNSSSSKFSTANCTISSHSSNANTPPDEHLSAPATATATATANASKTNSSSNRSNSTGNSTTSSIKFPNCISATNSDSVDGNYAKNNSGTTMNTSGYYSKTSNSSSKSSDSGLSAFNTLTQRLSNFSFLNNSDKKSSLTLYTGGGGGGGGGNTSSQRNHRKTMSLLKSYNNNNGNNNSTNGSGNGGNGGNHNANNFGNSTTFETIGIGGGAGGNSSILGNSTATSHSFGSLKLGKPFTSSHNSSSAGVGGASQSVITSYDPMKLIGTPACPRFDECPLLEPLICKKIAHERLTALIFREDCFLTACQDGYIYTWARPGYATNIPQHLSPSQTAPPGGTVI